MATQTSWAGKAWGIVRHHGFKWVASRLVLEAQKRTGWEGRIYPSRAWQADEWRSAVDSTWASASPAQVLAAWRGGSGAAWGRLRAEAGWREAYEKFLSPSARSALISAAENILAGRFTLFSRQAVETGFPPPWLCNPTLGPQATPPKDVHWSQISMRGENYGDLKYVWELSRFAWAFTLARAYSATGQEKFAEGFWALWMDWIDANPPNATAQWKCGQECSLRLMAVSFAVQVCANSAATTAARFVRHLGAVAALAARVARGGWYARLQDNNHSMSEAMGLYTMGVMFPELRDAGAWRLQGWQELEHEALRLIRPDGTFTQKSNNYHRLMLHDYLWSQSVAAVAGESWSPPVAERLRAAADYLRAVVDPVSGHAPNFGANDGAHILPLAESNFEDFRPVTQAAHFSACGRKLYAIGTGDESLLWLFGAKALSAPIEATTVPAPLAAQVGGLYTLRQKDSWACVHAEHFVDRPSHADQLHTDLWWRGLNIARDAGTYMYYGPPGLHSWFRGTPIHNTITVDGVDQMEPGPRFLWASRAQARIVERETESEHPGLMAEHDGYTRLPGRIMHRRGVRGLEQGRWLIWDEITGEGAHDVRLHWLLGDWPWETVVENGGLVLRTPQGVMHVALRIMADHPVSTSAGWTIRRAVEGHEAWGWQSRNYGEKTPALSLLLAVRGKLPLRFVTVFSPEQPAEWLLDASKRPVGVQWADRKVHWDQSTAKTWSLADMRPQ